MTVPHDAPPVSGARSVAHWARAGAVISRPVPRSHGPSPRPPQEPEAALVQAPSARTHSAPHERSPANAGTHLSVSSPSSSRPARSRIPFAHAGHASPTCTRRNLT